MENTEQVESELHLLYNYAYKIKKRKYFYEPYV